MVDSKAASRYVKSLLGLAIEQKALENVHNDMLLFSKTVDANKNFAAMLRSPVIAHDKKSEILSHEELFEKLYDKLPREFMLMRELLLSSLWRSPVKWELAQERYLEN